MRQCVGCGKEFQLWHVVDGKKKNFAGRKNCFECWPIGKRPEGKPKNIPYSEWPQERKDKTIKRYYDRGIERKQKIVEMKGGGCKNCGYNKCLRALTFHHRDASQKSFSLTAREIAGFSWTTLMEEIEKCDVLCYNCHMEIEDEIGKSKYSE